MKGWQRIPTKGVMAALAAALPSAAVAHDPVFGLGPHTLYEGGYEIHAGARYEQAGDGVERESELGVEIKYGIIADWSVGVEAPFVDLRDAGSSRSGPGDLAVSTKYRFWRNDMLGAQESAAVAAEVISDTGDDEVTDGATDGVLGLTYGYEGRKWYRWAAVRYRRNGEADVGLERGDRILVDLVGGIRPYPGGYRERDTVWMLELNGEHTLRAGRGGTEVANTGGTEWFVAPGLMWTLRNFALKTGFQVPVYQDLNGDREGSDFRALLELEWHLGD